jgi:Pyridoxamine 5'-phosphate oxidase
MSRRDQIRMSEAEVDAFLRRPGRTLNVASLGPDGNVHLVAMWYGLLSDGTVCFHTYAASQKVRNWERDPRFTALVEAGDTYDQLQGVELVGTVELRSDMETKLAITGSMAGRYPAPPARASGSGPASDGTAQRDFLAKRIGVLLHTDKVVSWDHTKLGGTY